MARRAFLLPVLIAAAGIADAANGAIPQLIEMATVFPRSRLPDGRLYEEPTIVRRPSSSQIASIYTAEAIGGFAASVRCRAIKGGRLRGCTVEESRPDIPQLRAAAKRLVGWYLIQTTLSPDVIDWIGMEVAIRDDRRVPGRPAPCMAPFCTMKPPPPPPPR